MLKKTKVLLMLYAAAVTLIAGVMTYTTVALLDASNIVEVIKPTACPTVTEQLETRAYELREDKVNKAMDLEGYRQEALRERNQALQAELGNSPFINYDELENKYGH